MPDAVHQSWQVSVYQVARTPYETLRAEIEHGHWAISHVRAGAVETLARGERAPAPAGAVMVHPPSLPYAEYASVPGVHEWVVFDCSLSPGLDLFRLHPVAPVVTLRDPMEFSQAFDLLLTAWEAAPSPFRDLRVSSLTALLLSLVLDDWRSAGCPSRSDALATSRDRFTGLIVFLSQNLHQRLTRADLAAFAHLRPNSLDRAFHAVYGLAPMQMLRDLRLQRARHLLRSTDLTLEAVAESCGFEDACLLLPCVPAGGGANAGTVPAGWGVESTGFGLNVPCRRVGLGGIMSAMNQPPLDTSRREQLLRDGFCRFDHVLTDEMLTRLRDASDRMVDAFPQAEAAKLRAQGSLLPTTGDPVFADLITWPAALDALASLGFTHPTFSDGYVIAKPGHSPRLFWHYDWFAWQDPYSFGPDPAQLFAMYYLSDTSQENGCLRVIPRLTRPRTTLCMMSFASRTRPF